MNKHGDATSIQFGNLTKIIVNIIIVLALLFFIGLIVYAILSKDTCDNQSEWTSISKALKQVDKSGLPLQIPFRNTDCRLVSFTPTQGYLYQLDNRFLSTKPMVCFCKIDTSVLSTTQQQAKCKPVSDCYKFENINTVTTTEGNILDTTNYGDALIFLKLKKQDSNLIIDFISPNIEYNEYSFDTNDIYIKKIILNSSIDLSNTALTLVPLDRYSIALEQRVGQQYKAFKLSLEPPVNPDKIKGLKLEMTFDTQPNVEPMQRDSLQGINDVQFSHGSTRLKYGSKEITATQDYTSNHNDDLSNEDQQFYEVKVDEKGIPDEIVLLT